MKYQNFRLIVGYLFLNYAFFVAATCQDEPDFGPKPSEFTKPMREQLGDLLTETIKVNTTQFNFLSEHDSVHWYLQTLYDQATAEIHADKSSVASNRWRADRKWAVHLLEDDVSKNAFCVPGGDFFITTGLLRALRSEHEFYYVAAFEASLMNSRSILNRLITEYDAASLWNLVDRQFASTTVTANLIVSEFPSLEYNAEWTQETDELTLDLICETSFYEPSGISSIIDGSPDLDWLRYKSYAGRAALVRIFKSRVASECGDNLTNGGFEKYVLDRLP